MISRDPHKILAVAWSIWFGAVLYALARPDQPAVGLVVLLIFLPLEAVGVLRNTGSRDTLSEIVTWVHRKLSKHKSPVRGWGALISVIVLCITFLLGRTFADYSGSIMLGYMVFGLTTIWLLDHWIDPTTHG